MVHIPSDRIPPRPTGWGEESKQKEPVAQMNIAQAAMNSEAKAVDPLALPIHSLHAWLLAHQNFEQAGMAATTGEDFTEHCVEFMRITDALNVIRRFEQQIRG